MAVTQQLGFLEIPETTTPAESDSPQTLAPMLQAYCDLQKQYPEHLLLYQVGDFYEVFFEGAQAVSDILRIRLTSRDKSRENPIPMCGVPIHALENYLPKLLDAGRGCIIVSQAEEVKDEKGKKTIRRAIERIVTPGVRFDGDGLQELQGNYLAAISWSEQIGCVILADVSTGSLFCVECENEEEIFDTIHRYAPAEIVVPSTLGGRAPSLQLKRQITALQEQNENLRIVVRPFPDITLEEVRERGKAFLRTELPDGGLGREVLSGFAAFFAYLEEVSFEMKPQLVRLEFHHASRGLVLDSSTIRNLELFQTARGPGRGTLFEHLRKTETACGARLLREWIGNPLTEQAAIESRLDGVADGISNQLASQGIRTALKAVRDLDRLSTRVLCRRISPKDLQALLETLRVIPAIFMHMESFASERFKKIVSTKDCLEDLFQLLESALSENPPLRVSDGGVFRKNYSSTLDELQHLSDSSHSILLELEERLRKETGITNLKIRYQSVFGYSIEVSKGQANRVPDYFERRQTLVNAERYATPELKTLEAKILSAKARALEVEKTLYAELIEKLQTYTERLQKLSGVLSEIDVLLALSTVAFEQGYIRPTLLAKEEKIFDVQEGKHPVTEMLVGSHRFVSNSVALDGEQKRFAVLTGPNMGGKSTYLRQIGILQILAQIGSYLPARSAKLSLVDRIFTRIGSADDTMRGDSTFLVEMREAALILKRASEFSLVLIDELGRGTSTTDGHAIAEAVCEWLIERTKCRTIFATHFHDLTTLAGQYPGVFCLSVGAIERFGTIEFTHRIEEKVGMKSFGVECARLAGVPEAILRRAGELLREEIHHAPRIEGELPPIQIERDPMFEERIRSLEVLEDSLKTIAVDHLTPIQALNELSRLQKLI
jgi:DNA mismatch repair protein MutS